MKVSVPSRGILFPNEKALELLNYGVASFRPLSGYLISKCPKYSPLNLTVMVSVPSRGILFPNGLAC